MPWKVCRPMDERLKFVARLLDGEKMAGLCREFGISRKTGYKILGRYHDSGLEALTDRSRRPYRHRPSDFRQNRLLQHPQKEPRVNELQIIHGRLVLGFPKGTGPSRKMD